MAGDISQAQAVCPVPRNKKKSAGKRSVGSFPALRRKSDYAVGSSMSSTPPLSPKSAPLSSSLNKD